MKQAVLLTLILTAIGCASPDRFHHATFDGAGGPLSVELVDFSLQRMGNRGDDPIMGNVTFDITNNSDSDVTVTKIQIAQRGMSTLQLDNPLRAFDRVVPEARTERFSVTGRVTSGPGGEVIERRDTVLALRVDVTIAPGITYEYEFDVPVSATEL